MDGFEPIELIKILSELSNYEPKEPFINTLDDDDVIEITTTVFELIDDYLKENILQMYEPNFHDKMCYEITYLMHDDWFEAGICDDDEIINLLRSIADSIAANGL